MTKPSTKIPSRNAPCPCGSGKKSKHCCGASPPTQEVRGRSPWLVAIGLIGVIAIAVYAMSVTSSSVSKPTPTLPAGATAPQPWQYDAATDQYWDPSHQHWHDGRPPAGAAPAAPVEPTAPAKTTAPAKPSVPAKSTTPAKPTIPTAPASGIGTAPKPFQYDPVENKYWDPAHQHWHAGTPPPQASRP